MPRLSLPPESEWLSLPLAHDDHEAGLLEIDSFFRSVPNSPEPAENAGPVGGASAAGEDGVAFQSVVEVQVSMREVAGDAEVADGVVGAVIAEATDEISRLTAGAEHGLAKPSLPQTDVANGADESRSADQSLSQMSVTDEVSDNANPVNSAASKPVCTVTSAADNLDRPSNGDDINVGRPDRPTTVNQANKMLDKSEKHSESMAESIEVMRPAQVAKRLPIQMLLQTDDELAPPEYQSSSSLQSSKTTADIAPPRPETDCDERGTTHGPVLAQISQRLAPKPDPKEPVATEAGNHVTTPLEIPTAASQSLGIPSAVEGIEQAEGEDTEVLQRVAEAAGGSVMTPGLKMARPEHVGRSSLKDEMREEEDQGLNAVDDTPVKFAAFAEKAVDSDQSEDNANEDADMKEENNSATVMGSGVIAPAVGNDGNGTIDIDPVATAGDEHRDTDDRASTGATSIEPDSTAPDSSLPAQDGSDFLDQDDDNIYVNTLGPQNSQDDSKIEASTQSMRQPTVSETQALPQTQKTTKRDRESASPDPLQGPPTKKLRGQGPRPTTSESGGHLEAAAPAVKSVRKTRQMKDVLVDNGVKELASPRTTTRKPGRRGKNEAAALLAAQKTRRSVGADRDASQTPVDSGTDSPAPSAKVVRMPLAAKDKKAAPAAKPTRKTRQSTITANGSDDELPSNETDMDTATATEPSKPQQQISAAATRNKPQLRNNISRETSVSASSSNISTTIAQTAAQSAAKKPRRSHPLAARELQRLSEIIEPEQGVKGKTRTKTRELEEASAKASAAALKRGRKSGGGTGLAKR